MDRSSINTQLHWLASQYAARPDIVQGAGGNISAKIDHDSMLIKASGRTFEEIGQGGQGLSLLNYQTLLRYLRTPKLPNAAEADHLAAVRTSTDPASTERPSMEVWFHALLGTFVLHTHSVYVNALACAHGGTERFRELMENNGIPHEVFSYYAPGYELGEAMARRLSSPPSVVFLENHGIIIAGDTAEACAALHAHIEEILRESLGMHDPFVLDELNEDEAREFESLVLFPDQVIYPTHKAIRAAHRYILHQCRKNGLTPRAIPTDQARAIAAMESEKYRKNLRT